MMFGRISIDRMTRCLSLLLAAALLLPATHGAAQGKFAFETNGLASEDAQLTDSVTVWESGDLSPLDDQGDDGHAVSGTGTASRYADITLGDGHDAAFAASRTPIASFGPFHLVSADTVEMIGTVDSASPRQFAALLAAHPGVRRLVMVECPGSVDEAANHVLARAVRRAGLATHVPDGGSVRSGAVDLFLAGVERTAGRTAEFGVHSWQDEDGMQARDFPADDAVHNEYLSYYREMGMDDRAAHAFYALTNSADFNDVQMLSANDMAMLGLARVSG